MSFPRHAKYRNSGLKWLGQIPIHWSVKRLRFVADLNPSKSEVSHLADDTEVSFLPMEAIGEDGSLALDRVRPLADVQTGYTFFRDGDVIIAKITPCFENGKGAVARDLYNGIGFGTTELIVTRPKPTETTSAYLHWLCTSRPFRKAGEAFMYGAGGQKRVPEDFVRDFAIGFPPLPEQRHIVTFLDREAAKIDALVEEQLRLIELLKEKRQAVISLAVTKGLDPNVPMKDSGVQWLGKVPAHWRIAPLGRVTSERCDGPFGSGIKSSHYTDEGALVVRLQNIRSGRFNMGEPVYLDAEYFQSDLVGHAVAQGDVLVAGLGDENNLLGRACVAPPNLGPALVKADCFRFRLDSNMCPEFIAHQLSAGAAFDAGQLSTGTTRSRIPLGIMAGRKVAYPPMDEQEAISEKIDEWLAALDGLACEAEVGIDLLHERRAALISAAVTGKIDVRGLVPQPEAVAA